MKQNDFLMFIDTTVRDQMRFCADFLYRNGIDNGNKFLDVLDSREDSDPKYRLVKIDEKLSFYESVAAGLRDLWPAGMKDVNGKEYPWRDSISNLATRLKQLWKIREYSENQFTKGQVLACARRYLSRYEDNTKYMKTLKYFILKKDIRAGVEQYESMLGDILEDKIAEFANIKVPVVSWKRGSYDLCDNTESPDMYTYDNSQLI